MATMVRGSARACVLSAVAAAATGSTAGVAAAERTVVARRRSGTGAVRYMSAMTLAGGSGGGGGGGDGSIGVRHRSDGYTLVQATRTVCLDDANRSVGLHSWMVGGGSGGGVRRYGSITGGFLHSADAAAVADAKVERAVARIVALHNDSSVSIEAHFTELERVWTRLRDTLGTADVRPFRLFVQDVSAHFERLGEYELNQSLFGKYLELLRDAGYNVYVADDSNSSSDAAAATDASAETHRTTSRDGEVAYVLHRLGKMHLLTNCLDEAVDVLSRALAIYVRMNAGVGERVHGGEVGARAAAGSSHTDAHRPVGGWFDSGVGVGVGVGHDTDTDGGFVVCQECVDAIAEVKCTLAIVHERAGDVQHALSELDECLALAPDDIDTPFFKRLHGRVYYHKGNIFRKMQDLPKAIELYALSVEAFGDGGDECLEELSSAHASLGYAYQQRGALELALSHYTSCVVCLERAEGADTAAKLGNMHANVGLVLAQLERYDDGLVELHTAERMLKDCDRTIDYTNVKYHVAQVLLRQGEHAGAEAVLRDTVAIVRDKLGQFFPAMLPLYRSLVEVQRKLGKNADADENEALLKDFQARLSRASHPDGGGGGASGGGGDGDLR